MRKLPILAATIILFIFNSWAMALDIYPLDDLQPGLMGIGKTVISGAKIENFDVEVLGLIPQSPPLRDLIMVKVSGEVMEKTGGVALGMSGTPVYINDRLVGAIGYTYGLTDHHIALVTPAETMFKIYDHMPMQKAELPLNAVPVTSPLVVGGMNPRATAFLKEALSSLPVQIMPAVGRSENVQEFPLEAGSMVGVQLLRGDFQVASFGTVTHVDKDGRFIAFGHPFTHGGDVAFFATNAYVHYTLPSLEIPFKIVSLGPTLGGIWQDRSAGLGGSVGSEPPYLSATIVVKDQNRNLRREYRVESITEETMMIPLLISSAYQSIDATLDRVGAGTSYVRLEFGTGNLSQRMIRENLFYSDSDIAVWSLTDLLAGLELLIDNNLQKVDLQDVQIEIEVMEERKTASIEKARPNMSFVAAGESVDVEVIIRPYRSETETRIMRIDIPPNTSPGPLTVTVRSGGADYFVSKPPIHTPILKEGDEEDVPSRAVISGAENLDVLVEEYMDREKNNEIVAEFYPFLDNPGSSPEVGEEEMFLENASYYDWPEASGEPQRVRLFTQFVIDGMASFDINVISR